LQDPRGIYYFVIQKCDLEILYRPFLDFDGIEMYLWNASCTRLSSRSMKNWRFPRYIDASMLSRKRYIFKLNLFKIIERKCFFNGKKCLLFIINDTICIWHAFFWNSMCIISLKVQIRTQMQILHINICYRNTLVIIYEIYAGIIYVWNYVNLWGNSASLLYLWSFMRECPLLGLSSKK